MKTLHTPLLPGKVYHLFNHAVGTENLFRENRNYTYFLEKYRKYATPVCRTFSYALLPNHFHILVQIRSDIDLAPLMTPGGFIPNEQDCAKFVMRQFSNFFNAYAKAYNKLYHRKGALFIDYLRRKPVENNAYFQNAVLYQHFNAVRHGFSPSPVDYRFSSFPAYLSQQPSLLERNTVIQKFGGQAEFMSRHKSHNWRLEDDLDF